MVGCVCVCEKKKRARLGLVRGVRGAGLGDKTRRRETGRATKGSEYKKTQGGEIQHGNARQRGPA